MCSARALVIGLALLAVAAPTTICAEPSEVKTGFVLKEDGTITPIGSVNTDASKAAQQALQDAQLLPPALVTSILGRVAGLVAASGADPAPWKAAAAHANLLVQYLRQQGPERLMQAMRRLAQDGDSPVAVAELLAAARKFDAVAFSKWAYEAVTGMEAPTTTGGQSAGGKAAPNPAPAPAAAPKTTKKRSPTKTKPAPPKAPDMNDPLTQMIDWSKRIKALGGRLDFLLNDANPKSPPANSPYRNIGTKTFKPRKIGLVFHAMLFKDAQGFLYPPQAYWQGVRAGRRMLKKINELFLYSGTNIQFYLKAFRSDVKKYPYLRYKSLEDYQKCASLADKCTCHLAGKHSLEPSKYINIFLVGSSAYRGYNAKALAFSSAIPGFLDSCGFLVDPLPTSLKATETHDSYYDYDSTAADYPYTAASQRYQHIWASWDAMDMLNNNAVQSGNEGPANLAHELGHMLGLLHVFGTSCTDKADGVADTSTEEYYESALNSLDLGPLCKSIARGKLPTAASVKTYDSCPKQKYIDNIFNIMSYSPAYCRFLFTKGQVVKMQANVQKYNPKFGAN